MAQIVNFPSEILVKIFSELDGQTLLGVSKTCSRFQEILTYPLIWKNKEIKVTLRNQKELEAFLKLAPVFSEIKSLSLTLFTDCTDQILKYFNSLTDLHLNIDVRHCSVPKFCKWNPHLILSLKSLHLKMSSCSHRFLLKFVILSNLESLSFEGEEPVDIGPFFYHPKLFLMKKLTKFQIRSPMFLNAILLEGFKGSVMIKEHLPHLVEVLLKRTYVNSFLNIQYDKDEKGIVLNQRYSGGPITNL